MGSIKKSAVFENNVASEDGGAISSPFDATFELPEDTVFEGNYVRYVRLIVDVLRYSCSRFACICCHIVVCVPLSRCVCRCLASPYVVAILVVFVWDKVLVVTMLKTLAYILSMENTLLQPLVANHCASVYGVGPVRFMDLPPLC